MARIQSGANASANGPFVGTISSNQGTVPSTQNLNNTKEFIGKIKTAKPNVRYHPYL